LLPSFENDLASKTYAVIVHAKKSPYREDTGIPELLLPRCANGVKSDWHTGRWFPDYLRRPCRLRVLTANAALKAGAASADHPIKPDHSD
jgi:hypothetical protein